MQPYLFPYLGYFDLINYTNRWVVFDSAQYIRHGWVNRNRILHPHQGWQYVIAPLQKHEYESSISAISVVAGGDWRKRILGQIEHYRRRSPHFAKTRALVEDCLAETETSLARLNTSILAKVCHYLGIAFEFDYFSEMNLHLGAVEGPGDWALRISEAIGVNEYVNPSGGAGLFDAVTFGEIGVKLTLRSLPQLRYATPGYEFVPDLSIIDVLMWNEPEVIKRYLDRY